MPEAGFAFLFSPEAPPEFPGCLYFLRLRLLDLPEDQEVATEENTDIPEIQEELPEKKGKQNLPPALDVELID